MIDHDEGTIEDETSPPLNNKDNDDDNDDDVENACPAETTTTTTTATSEAEGSSSPPIHEEEISATIITTDAQDEEEQEEEQSTTTKIYAKTPMDVLTSKFVIGQLIFNILASFLGPLGTFFLLFGYLSEGPYEWTSGPLIGVVLGSLLGSPILIFALMPVGLPEAVENGWFLRLHDQEEEEKITTTTTATMTLGDVNNNNGDGDDDNNNDDDNNDNSDNEEMFWIHQCWWMSPFLFTILKWRWSTQRNVILSLLIGIIYVPIALLIARYVFGPTLATWTLIWLNVIYQVVLAIPVLTLGLLGYSFDTNLDVTIEQMNSHPPTNNSIVRILYRSLISLRMTICPY